MFNKIKQSIKNNEKGFTLVEILVVIVIIGILFTVLLPRIDFAGDRARQKGVQTDFRSYQLAFESVFKEYAGEGFTPTGINSYLDEALKLTETTAITPAAFVTYNAKSKLDPWKTKYKIHVIDPPTTTAKGQVSEAVIQTAGNDGQFAAITPASGTVATPGDDFLMYIYYKNGIVDSCTIGFEASEMKLTTLTSQTCGALII